MSDGGEFFRALLEVFKTKKVLTWVNQSGLHTAGFILDSQSYCITIRENIANDIATYEVSFAAPSSDCRLRTASNFNKNQFKIIGIVSNGIKEKIKGANLVYFTENSYSSDSGIEYHSKMKMHSRLAHKMAIELDMYQGIKSSGDKTVFVLASSQQLLDNAVQRI